METIDDVLDYIFSLTNLEGSNQNGVHSKHYSLTGIEKILEALGNIQENKKIIHIAGTKGKGSVSFMLTYFLNKAKYSTLTFMSPHLVKSNERILINGSPILDIDLIRLSNSLKNTIESNNLESTTFEFFFVIALMHGIENNVDFFVIETGLGGRLDCTNVLKPILSIITSIGFDHTEILGKTIKKIATEKAGIIKEKTPVIITKQKYNCLNVFKKIALNNNSPYIYAPNQVQIKKTQYNSEGIKIKFNYNKIEYNFILPFYGLHQIDNFIAVFVALKHLNISISDNIDIKLPGRIQCLDYSKHLIVDVSHTKESFKSLVHSLKKHFKISKWNILFSLADGKDYHEIIKTLIPYINKIVITNLSSYKKNDVESLYNIAKHKCPNVKLISDQKVAFKEIMKNEKNILITGSFYLTGPFIEWYKENNY